MEETRTAPQTSIRKLAWTFLAIATWLMIVLLAFYFRIDYWMKTPPEKFVLSWKQDLAILKKANTLPKAWSDIGEVKFSTDQSPAREWMQQVTAPIEVQEKGTHRLEIFVMHWIENRTYGVIIEYYLIDRKTNNTVWELGRTLNLGFIL